MTVLPTCCLPFCGLTPLPGRRQIPHGFTRLKRQSFREGGQCAPVLWSDQLEAAAPEEVRWLWHGYLAAENVTLLTSQWKSGKTTLLALLLARRRGGGLLAGRAVAPGKTVVVSEEGPAHWRRRRRLLDFGPGAAFICRPFRTKPTHDQWLALIDQLGELHVQHGVDLAVIDPLAAFLPGRDESGAAAMLEALMPLQRLTGAGMAVEVLHHPRKGESQPGQAARGSGALAGYVDIVVEMDWFARDRPDDRRRRLRAFSRLDETPRELVIEWTADGTDYVALGDFLDGELEQNWDRLRLVLQGARGPLSRGDILEAWPPDLDPPGPASLWRWLERAAERGLLRREGTGVKNHPFRYWLPDMEARWKDDPLGLKQQDEEMQRWLESLGKP